MAKLPGQIKDIRQSRVALPTLINVDLSTADADRRFNISGNVFYIWSAPDSSAYVQVRFNERDQAQIPFYQQTGLKVPFDCFYLTVPAGLTGTMVLLIASEAPEFLEVIDNRSATSAELTEIRAQLQGDSAEETWGTEKTVGVAAVQILAANADRKGCIIQSKAANAGLVYIGFDNTVATNKWIAELGAGMSFDIDDYRGALYAIASAAGQLVGYGEW